MPACDKKSWCSGRRLFSGFSRFFPLFHSLSLSRLFLHIRSFRFRWRRQALPTAVLVLLLGVGARAMINLPGLVRLTPLSVTVTPEADLPAQVQALETQTVGQAFDRDTTTLYTPYGNDQIRVTFEAVEAISRLRFYGPAPCRLSVSWDDGTGKLTAIGGWTGVDLSRMGPGWNTLDLSGPVSCASLVLSLSPETPTASSGTGIAEMEFWGQGWAQNEANGEAWDAWLNSASGPSSLMVSGREYLGAPGNGSASGVVTVGGNSSTASFTVNLPMAGTQYRRMWLVYDVNGLSSWIAVPRTINGKEAAGGWPLPGTSQWCTEVEAIQPSWMNAGTNTITFSMPNGTVNPYEVQNLKLVVEEDDGANLIDEIDASAGNAGVLTDGDETTGWRPYVDGEGGSDPTPSLTFWLYRPQQLDSLKLYVANSLGGQVIESVLQDGTWEGLGDVTNGKGLGAGWQSLPVSATGPVQAVELRFRGGDGSAGEIMEAMAEGSGVGKPYGQTIEVTYPDAGEFYGTEAYIRGFLGQADDGSGQAQVMLGSQPAQVMNGQFEGIVSMDQVGVAAGSQSWAVTVTAVYPDGAQVTKVVALGQQVSGGTGSGQGTYAQMLNAGQSTVLNVLGAQLSVSADALQTKVNLQVVPLSTTDLEPMNPGMTNVTGGTYQGYRFLPHGTIFKSQVKVSLPYDPAMLPNGKTVADVRTFYFDVNRGMWVALPLSSTNTQGQMLVSLTTHFTDFINATITVPDSPQEIGFNPTQLKGIKAADPGSEVNFIEPPSANNEGTADLSYPLEVPPGRHGLAPQLAVRYDSSGGDSWMGLGWNLSCPQITVETRWGAPRYSGSQETEDYLLNGQQLVALTASGPYLAHRNAWIGRQSGPVTFMTRVEGDFQRIIRYGSAPVSYYWEVDSKNGARSFYGGSLESGAVENGTSDPAVLTTDTSGNRGNACQWNLREMEDRHGNTVKYHYGFSSYGGSPSGSSTGNSGGVELYPDHVTYTGSKGSDGPYQVKFVHGAASFASGGVTTIQTRPDVQVYAKCGFPRATADLLDHVDVTLNGALIRRYQFTYIQGAFSKTLLNSIQQFGAAGEPFPGNTHRFTYFNDLQQNGNNGFLAQAVTLKPQSNNTQAADFNVVGALTGNLIDPHVTALGGSTADEYGFSAYGGFGFYTGTKMLTVGYKRGGSHTDSSTVLTWLSMTGRGLPDMVYLENGSPKLQANPLGPGPLDNDLSVNSTTLGPPQAIQGLDNLGKESSGMSCQGGEAYFIIPAILNSASMGTKGTCYFSDVNGAGMPDLVENGTVHFAHVNGGAVSFSTDSSDTEVPIVQGQAPSTALFTPQDHSAAVTQYPMADALRRWVAPYSGVVTLNCPVTLFPTPSPTPSGSTPVPGTTPTPSTTPDGVKVDVELDHTDLSNPSAPVTTASILATAVIPASMMGTQAPLPVAPVNVAQGDRIYFRLQSGAVNTADGNYDQVAWDQDIRYQSLDGDAVATPVLDENNLDLAHYHASTDFTLAGRRGVDTTAPLSGTLVLTGDFTELSGLSDSVAVSVIMVENTVIPAANPPLSGVTQVLWTGTLAPGQAGSLPYGPSAGVTNCSDCLQFPVTNYQVMGTTISQGTTLSYPVTSVYDTLYFVAGADSNVDLSKIQWPATLTYGAFAPPQGTATATPTPAITPFMPPYDIDFYPENDLAGPQVPTTVALPEFVLPAPPVLTSQQIAEGWSTVLVLQGSLALSGTANPVTVTVVANDNMGAPVFQQVAPPGTGTGTVAVQGNIPGLAAGTDLRVRVLAATEQDLSALSFAGTYPSLYFAVLEPGGAVDAQPVTYKPAYEGVVSQDGTTHIRYLNAVPSLSFATATTSPTPSGPETVMMTIKDPALLAAGKDSLAAKGGPFVVNPNSVAVATAPVTAEVLLGDPLFFSFYSRSGDLVTRVGETGGNEAVTCYYGSPGLYGSFEVDSSLSDQPPVDVFALPYRGWAVAGYNGTQAGAPVSEAQLAVPVAANSAGTSAVFQQAANSQTAWSFAPQPGSNSWQGPDPLLWAAPASMSSTRLGMHNIAGDLAADLIPTGGPASGESNIARFDQLSSGNQNSGSLGPLGIGSGNNTSSQDLIDMNGDGFPSMVSGNGTVQYTLPTGGMDGSTNVPGLSGIRQNSSAVTSVDVLGAVGLFSQAADAIVAGSQAGQPGVMGNNPPLTADKESQMAPFGLNGSNSVNDSNYDLIDMNGDGLPDRVWVSGGNLVVALNMGYGFAAPATWDNSGWISHTANLTGGVSANLVNFNSVYYSFAGGLSGSAQITDTGRTLVDVNGDGLPDLVWISGYNDTTSPIGLQNGTVMVAYNTGSGFAAPVAWSNNGVSQKIGHHTGTSFGGGAYFTVSFPIPLLFVVLQVCVSGGGDLTSSVDTQNLTFMDMNGDGYPDLVAAQNDVNSSNSIMAVNLNTTGRTNLLKSVSRPMGGTLTLDYQRDGNTYADPHSRWNLATVAQFDGGQNGNAAKGGADYQAQLFTYQNGQFDRWDREFLGYGTVTSTQMDTRGWNGPSSGPVAGLPPYRRVVESYLNDNIYDMKLVSEQATLDVSGGSPQTFLDTLNRYQLWDAVNQASAQPLTALAGKGIQQVYSIFPQLLEASNAFYEPGSSAPVTTYQTYAYDRYGNVTQYADGGDNAADAVTASVSYTATDPNTAFQANYLVGLPETITVNGAGGLLRQRQAAYDTNLGDLLTVQSLAGNGVFAQSDMAYDSAYGNLTTVTGPANLHGQRYQLSYQYDSVVNTYPTVLRDSFGYTSTQSYDLRFGKPALEIDENNNAVQDSYDDFGRTVTVTGPFDKGGYSLAFDYHPEAPVPYAHTAHNDSAARGPGASLDTLTLTDGLDRVLQTKQTTTFFQGANLASQNGVVASGRVVYDQAGRAAQQFYPVTETGASGSMSATLNPAYEDSPTVTFYDALDRPLTMTRPDGKSTLSSYAVALNNGENQLLTTVFDVNGNKKQTYKDVKGLIETVMEYDPAVGSPAPSGPAQVITTQYAYDPMKEITQVTDAKGNITASSYDLLGRRTAIQNPDTGKTVLTYDPAGNVIKKVTANLAKEDHAVGYDYQFNRLSSVTYPDFPRNNVTYAYGFPGAANNQAARIAAIQDGSGTLARDYDALGNAVTETRVLKVPSTGAWTGESAWDKGTLATAPVTYVTAWKWDDWNRVLSMAYPDGEALTYQYDAGGSPKAVSGVVPANGNSGSAGTYFPYVTRLEYDKFGSRKFVQNGNGTQASYTYDTDSGSVTALHRLVNLTAASGPLTFQALNYAYDPVGNITTLNNAAPRETDGLSGPVSQSFEYDGLYRLTRAQGAYSGLFDTAMGTTGSSTYNLAMTYDPIHNITEKNQLVETSGGGAPVTDNALTYDWNYLYQGAQPHAPSQVGTRTFAYDFNGNQSGFTDLSGTGRAIVWDEENRMEGVEEGAGDLSNGGIRFVYDDAGMRTLKIDHQQKITAYVNQFYTVENPLAGAGALADKHIFLGNARIATHMVQGPASASATSTSNTTDQAQWIGSWGVSIAGGNTDAVNFGSPGNFITITADNTQVLGAPQVWTKGVQVLGTVNSCKVLTLQNPKPQGGYFIVSYNNQTGYVPSGDAVVGIPNSCMASTATNAKSLIPGTSFVFFYHTDHLGSTGYMTDENGTLSEHLEYIPFGETWTQQERGMEIFPDYEFTGQELDTETGLYYFGARYYDPRTSVWQSADPILSKYLEGKPNDGVFNSINLSLYGYVGLRPLIKIDEIGKSSNAIDDITGWTAVQGAFYWEKQSDLDEDNPGLYEDDLMRAGAYKAIANQQVKTLYAVTKAEYTEYKTIETAVSLGSVGTAFKAYRTALGLPKAIKGVQLLFSIGGAADNTFSLFGKDLPMVGDVSAAGSLGLDARTIIKGSENLDFLGSAGDVFSIGDWLIKAMGGDPKILNERPKPYFPEVKQ